MISDQRDENRPLFTGSGRRITGVNPCKPCYPVSMDDVLDSANMADAWKRVQRNKGAPGPDARTIEETASFLKTSWPEFKEELRSGSYQPGLVRTVYIPKSNGKQRMLGISNVSVHPTT